MTYICMPRESLKEISRTKNASFEKAALHTQHFLLPLFSFCLPGNQNSHSISVKHQALSPRGGTFPISLCPVLLLALAHRTGGADRGQKPHPWSCDSQEGSAQHCPCCSLRPTVKSSLGPSGPFQGRAGRVTEETSHQSLNPASLL